MVLPYSSASSWSLQGFSTLQATWVGGLMSVHSFSSTVLVSPDELILMHSTVRGWTPGPQEVEHYAQAWHKIQIKVLKSVLGLDLFYSSEIILETSGRDCINRLQPGKNKVREEM